ncbi:hypothetical protein V6N13_074274 [Hibiscus sabdariffa]
MFALFFLGLFDFPCNSCINASCLQGAKEGPQRCLGGCSSSSRLEGAVLEIDLSADALPFLWVEWSFLVPSPAMKLGRMGCGAPLVIANQRYHSHHQMRDELLLFHQPSQRGLQTIVIEWQQRSRLGVLPRVGQRSMWQ